MMRARLSFSTRIALYFGALFLAAMLVLALLWYCGLPWAPAWLTINGAGSERLAQATRLLELAADQQRGALAAAIEQRRGDVLVFSQGRAFAQGLGRKGGAVDGDLQRVFDRLQRAYPDAYQAVRVVDPASGRIRASSAAGEAGSAFADPALVRRASRPGMTELIEQIDGPQGPTLAIVRQIHAPDADGYPSGELVAILVVYLDTVRLIDGGMRAERDGALAPGATLLFGPGGALLARFPAGAGKLEPFRRDARLVNGFEGTLAVADAGGGELLAVYRHLQLSGAQGWTLVHYQSQDEALAGLNSDVRTLIGVGLLLTALALLLIGFAARRLTAPLQLLSGAARRFGAGDWLARAAGGARASREVAELAEAFNAMAASIGQAHLELEQRVRERTAELGRERDRVRRYLDIAGVMLMALDRDGNIAMINRKGAEMLGRPEHLLLGQNWFAHFVPRAERAAQRAAFDAMLADPDAAPVGPAESRIVTAAGVEVLMAWNVSVLRGADRAALGVLSSGENITERRRAEQRERHHHGVLRMLAEKAPLLSVLDTIARDVEESNPHLLCSILLLDEEGRRLLPGAAPSLPAFYTAALDGLVIGPGVGSCGSAAFSGERVIVEDIDSDFRWSALRDLARRAGLAACWSQPILSPQGKVLGTFALYPPREARRPTPAHLQLIDDAARLAGLAIGKASAEARLQLAAGVFTHAREGIMLSGADGNLIEVNDSFTRITGYARDEVLGRNPRMLQSGLQGPEFYGAMWRDLARDGYWDGEIWNRRKNGEVYAQMLTISAVRDDAGVAQHYVALFTDITPLKEHQQQLEHIAHYDALTSLPNRTLLADRLQRAMLHSARGDSALAVVYLDLDGFKAINDKHGHDVGDSFLVAVGQRMKEALRAGDTLARIGGDEFVAVLVDLDQPQDCEPVLERLLAAAAAPATVGTAALQVSASIGVTLYPRDDADADLLIRHADQAMYLAKQAGKNRYHLFDVEQDTAVQTLRESLLHIGAALARQEFVLYYQPKVNMRSGAVIGAEALIRWQHPTRGLLPPAAFLPAIEDHPISVELGEWVIDSALKQMREWQQGGLELPVSVNIGARQLQQGDFVQRLSLLLAAHPEVRPCQLELEILETSALEDMAQVSEVMRACRAIGVRFALDDFGTGYSSLTYLKRLPVELLKIDQSFVRYMLDDPENLAIIEGVVGLATAFRRNVIAEGVETVAHGALLLPLGCELAQGYGIARPMPAAAMPGWVAGWRPDPAWSAWRERTPTPEDQVAVFAEVEHRHWLRGIEAFLAGPRHGAPPQPHDCRFIQWWEQGGHAARASYPNLRRASVLHGQLHALARELIERHLRGGEPVAAAQMAQLAAMCADFVALLYTAGKPAAAPEAQADDVLVVI
jgi:diguanylate cyclase (GGDEF)-like protein/PAS domain S-box-containing protein